MTYRDGIYGRISQDDTGLAPGVTAQLADCRTLSAARDGTVTAEHHDNDLSAFKGATRPGYDRLIEDITAGRLDRIVVWRTDRLWRNRVERAVGIELLKDAGVSVVAVRGPDLDMTTAAGRFAAGILGEFDTTESEVKSERVTRAALRRFEAGRAASNVSYGWRRVYDTNETGIRIGWHDAVHEPEACIVREIVHRILSGESVRSIISDLNARGVPAPGAKRCRKSRGYGQADDGSTWMPSTPIRLAVRPANIGLRVHHHGRPDERVTRAEWDPIVDPDDHHRVVAMLADPQRRPRRPGGQRWLITAGIGRCGVCGAPLRVRHNTGRAPVYLCSAGEHVGRNVAAVNDLVFRVLDRYLARPNIASVLSGDQGRFDAAMRRAEALRGRLDTAAGQFARGLITDRQLEVITAELRPQAESAEAEAQALMPAAVSGLLAEVVDGGRSVRDLQVSQARELMRTMRIEVVINPTSRRGPGIDPRSVVIRSTRPGLA
jgi:site-specific DNA recombinase